MSPEASLRKPLTPPALCSGLSRMNRSEDIIVLIKKNSSCCSHVTSHRNVDSDTALSALCGNRSPSDAVNLCPGDGSLCLTSDIGGDGTVAVRSESLVAGATYARAEGMTAIDPRLGYYHVRIDAGVVASRRVVQDICFQPASFLFLRKFRFRKPVRPNIRNGRLPRQILGLWNPTGVAIRCVSVPAEYGRG